MVIDHKEFARINLEIFQGKNPGCILWQPRIEFWYEVNKKRDTLPSHLQDASLMDVFDYCHASVRYFTNPLRVRRNRVLVSEIWMNEKSLLRTWQTPVGTLSETLHYDEWKLSCYNSDYKLKTLEDFKVFEYILKDEEWFWDQTVYEEDLARVDGRGLPQFFFRRSPIQGLFIENMGFEASIFMMYDHPEVIERYVETASTADDAMYKVICNCPVPVLNFGENIDSHMDPPRLWRKHLLPYYVQRVEQLHAAGKQVYIHVDGAMKPLIGEVSTSPFDAIEACTPLPQGDVTLQEIKTALGERVLLDGIPAVYFLPTFSIETLHECVEEIVQIFFPGLILGISDEIPPDGDIERVRMVGEWVQSINLP